MDQFIGMKCTCGAHKAHIVARPFGGANKITNRLEYLMVRAMQDALDTIARDLDAGAGSVRGILGNFEARRNLALGPAFRIRVHHVLEQIAQEATRNAEILLTKARAKQGKPIGAKTKKKTAPSLSLVPTGPSLTQQMTPWKDLVNGITDHVVQSTDRIADDLKDRLTTSLKEGYSNGEGARDLGKRVQDALSVDKNRAEAKARTLTMETYNQAHLVQYKEYGASGVAWTASPDERECDYCADLDGSIWALDDPDLIRPPAHTNCLLPETRCKAPGGIVMGLRSRYDGPVHEFTFASGTKVTVTPNHMLFTPHGFAAANLLREGDDIFYCPGFERIGQINPDNNREPPTIEEIFKSLMKIPGMITRRVPTSSEDLHGDSVFGEGYIDIIAPASLLRDANKPPGFKHPAAENFHASGAIPGALFGDRTLTNFFICLATTAGGNVGGSRQSSAFFRGRLTHPEVHGLTTISGSDPILHKDPANPPAVSIKKNRKNLNRFSLVIESDNLCRIKRGTAGSQSDVCRGQPATDSTVGNMTQLCDLINTQPGLIKTDNIVNINVTSYHGYVYDLQTISSLLIGNSVLMSNCRCVLSPMVDDLPDDAGEVSDDTRAFCENWRDKYLDVPLYSPTQ